MTREEITEVIEAQGYRCDFRDYISARGNGTSWVRVQAWIPGSRKSRSFGRVEEVMKLDKDSFAKIIIEAFARKGRR